MIALETEAMLQIHEVKDRPKVLLVDDNIVVRSALKAVLSARDFRVTTAANVREALHLIDTEMFDVLLSDLHMPGAADGFTVVSAMYHSQPNAVRLILTGYPELRDAMDAILSQANEILVKPVAPAALISLIREKLQNRHCRDRCPTQRLSCILEHRSSAIIEHWLDKVHQDTEMMSLPLDAEQRIGCLPKLIEKLVNRLTTKRNAGELSQTKAAVEHGTNRYLQGYSIRMMVEESRLLNATLFQTLQDNMGIVDFSSFGHRPANPRRRGRFAIEMVPPQFHRRAGASCSSLGALNPVTSARKKRCSDFPGTSPLPDLS